MDEHVPDAAGSNQTTARLRERSARLAAAMTAAGETSYRASTDAGTPVEIAVTATGLGRILKVHVGPKAMQAGPKALGPALIRLLNEAITRAREQAAEGVDETAQPGVRAALLECGNTPEAAEKLAGEHFSAGSPDEKVTVTATGTGEITKVKIDAAALKGGNAADLAEQITAAANGAIDAAQHRQRELSGSLRAGEQDLDKALDAQLAEFNQQMDELLGRIHQASQPSPDTPKDS